MVKLNAIWEKLNDKTKTFFKEWVLALGIAIVTLWLFVSFVGNWFVVSSSSMENELLTGDLVYVNKLAYGPRTPISFFGWSFPYSRLGGFSEIKQHDLVAFNYPDLDTLVPIDKKSVWIKRVIGLPGDRVEFKQAMALVNGKKEGDLPEVKKNYHIKLSGDEAAFFLRIGITDGSRISKDKDWLIQLSKSEAETLQHDKQVEFIRLEFHQEGKYSDDAFPYELETGWNSDFYGPVVVPQKGTTVQLTIDNIPLYRLCIEAYEGKELLELGDKFYMNGQQISSYTFEQDYYFVAGDNRSNSMDSRNWGFLPESHLIGRVEVVFFSFDLERSGFWKKIRWNRFLKRCK